MNKKKSAKNIVLFLFAFILFSCNASLQNADVDPSTFQQHITPDVQLLDVRTPGEYQAGHIKNALLANWMDKEEFTNGVKYLDKDKPVLVYCSSGSRSGEAAKWLADNGFTHIENLKGGFTEWKLENKPFESMNVTQTTIDEYYASLKSDKPVLVDFSAEWCAPCKKMQAVLAALQNEMKDNFKLVKVDGGINIAIMQQLNVSTLPTFIVYKNEKEVWRQQGIVTKEELEKKLSR